MRKSILFYLSAVLLLSSCAKNRIKEHPDWAKYFEAQQIHDACFMMFDNNHESIHYYNKERCTKRYVPASTFNIFNCLAALESNVAPDDQMIIRWDSVVRSNASWNKDMNMREAVTTHAIPYFQELARRTGTAAMQHYLDTVKYGNMKIGDKLDICWLNNTLQISADEQVGFLKRLYFHELPFSERAQRIVRSMLMVEDIGDNKLYYYTGTANTAAGDTTIRWVIGYVEKVENMKEPKGSQNTSGARTYPYFFAQNFSMAVNDTTKDWSAVRLQIAHQILTDYGALSKTTN
jgi:beta-lactamase class D